ncbi:MAG: T9SS type A sorting domain-containing protein [Flavobacteriales bacterium]|jgi:hypothetical protein|nr:T9SS type A sorting domain-containing protein [Flavobacteriales bacterium]
MKHPKTLHFTLLFFLCLLFNLNFYSQTYSATDSVSTFIFSAPYTNNGKGFSFSPDTTISISQLGKRVPNALGNYTWTIWDIDNMTLLHQQASLTNVADVYTYEPISSPLILLKGKQYALVLYCDATVGSMFYLSASSQINTHLTYISGLTCNNCSPSSYTLQSNPGLHMGFADFHFCIPSTGIDTQIACNSYTWIDGNTYNSSNNTATHTILGGAANGCDSIVTLNLTINHSTSGVDTQTACDSYTWIDGNTYTSSNNSATHTLTNSVGCDSVVTLNLTVNYATTGTDTQIACDSYTWIDGNTYTSSNNSATHTLTNSVGCDSVVTLNLTINNTTTGIDTQIACDSYTWIDGNTYTSSNNTATHTLTNSFGCDSVVTLNLTINNTTTGIDTQIACDSYTWIDGNTYTSSNNTATHTLTNSLGCDSVVTLNLTVNHATTGTDTQTACDVFTWIDGNTYTSSNNTATHTLTNSSGCDSVVTLNLTINHSTIGLDTQIACDSFTWIDGNTYTSSNNLATYTLPNSVGCDSIVTLNLTINHSTTGIDTQTACDTYTWIDGNTYTSSNNTATHTLTNSVGCDSIITLNLTLNHSTTGIDTQTACNSYTWIDGNTYTSSNNTATHTLSNSVGCDSVVTLNLTILTAVSHTQTINTCAGEPFTVGTDTYYTSGTYVATLTSQDGCDSIVTTNLIVAEEIDTYVERLNADFSVKPIANASYQWLDCDNGYSPIVGATSPNFTATEIGFYAVAIDVDNCRDTSICNHLPYIVSIAQEQQEQLKVYPNPTKDLITIEHHNNSLDAKLTITDLSGRILHLSPALNQEKITISTAHFKNGLYLITLESYKHTETLQFIKH